MKYLRKKKRSIIPWLVAALAVVLVALILVLTLMPGNQPTPNGETTAPNAQPGETQTANPTGVTGGSEETEASESTEAPTQPAASDLEIETPYVTLVYPGQWSSQLQVEKIPGDPYRVIFNANLESGIRQELFTICFGGNLKDAVGVVKVSGKEVPVQVYASEIIPGSDWAAEDTSVIYTMQECLNDVLVGLNLTTPQEKPQETEPVEDDEAMTIDTPAGELVYPARWKDYLKLEIRQENGYTVEFYAMLEGFDPVHLFDVHLDREQGIYVMDLPASDGSVMKLYVDIFEIEPDNSWTEAQKAIVFAMQEDMNFLLAALME